MIVAAETNFVLQLALQQEEGHAAESILDLAANRQIELVIPACALFEPHGTIVRRHKRRGELVKEFKRESQELARSRMYAGIGRASQAVTDAMKDSEEIEAKALGDAIERIAHAATIIPLTGDIVLSARRLRQLVYTLASPDAIIIASLNSYLRSRGDDPKVLTTTDASDFMAPEVRDYLVAYNCRIVPRFSDALGYIQSQLARQLEL